MTADLTHDVVTDGSGRAAVWPSHLDLPPAWTPTGRSGTRAECVDHLDALPSAAALAATLSALPDVALARAVTGRPLVEVVLAGSRLEELHAGTVEAWEAVFDDLYDADRSPTAGWEDSTTGDALPDEVMADWVGATRRRLATLPRERVLEIGSGSGLVAAAVLGLGGTSHYLATDLVDSEPDDGPTAPYADRVRRLVAPAHRVPGLVEEDVDLVVLHSVVQYFPSTRYLADLLRELVPHVRPGGHVYLGDVRHAGLDPVLATERAAVELRGAGPRGRADRARELLATSDELSFLPAWFDALPGVLLGVTRCDVVPRLGHADSEMTRCRFDVLLHVGCDEGADTPPPVELTALRADDVAALAAGGAARRFAPNGWFDPAGLTAGTVHDLAEGHLLMRLVDDGPTAALDLARVPDAPACSWGPPRRHAPATPTPALAPRRHEEVVADLLDRAGAPGHPAVRVVVTDLWGSR